MEDEKKSQSNLGSKNTYLKSKLTKVTSKLETTKLQHAELETYNTIVKRGFTQHFQKLYSNIEQLDEKIMAQRLVYDKTRIEYNEVESPKSYEVTKELDLVIQRLDQQ